jgi:CRP-like cAMP-binding protein
VIDRRALLRGCPYFAELDDVTLDAIDALARERRFNAGQRVFSEGEGAGEAALHVVAHGLIRVFKLSSEGREQVLRLMRPGDSFADVPAFDGGPYPAHSDALEPSVLLVIPRAALQELMRAHPQIALGALTVMAGRLRHMTALVEDLSLRRVTGRVARLLLAEQGDTRLTQGQMATMIGAAREMVNRSLHTLADARAIALQGQQIVVLDQVKLVEIVEAG